MVLIKRKRQIFLLPELKRILEISFSNLGFFHMRRLRTKIPSDFAEVIQGIEWDKKKYCIPKEIKSINSTCRNFMKRCSTQN